MADINNCSPCGYNREEIPSYGTKIREPNMPEATEPYGNSMDVKSRGRHELGNISYFRR